MFDFFSQKRLKNRGLSSGKKRRKTNDSEFKELLRTGKSICGLLFILFAVAISVWLVFSSSPTAIFAGKPLQTIVVVFVITGTLMIHWHVSLPSTFWRNSRVLLMLLVILAQLGLIQLSSFLADNFAPEGGFRFVAAPYAFAAVLISLLIGRRHATFAVVYSSLLGGLMVNSFLGFKFLIFSLICGFVAIYLSDAVRRRSRLVMAGIYVGFACVLLALTLGEIQIPDGGEWNTWQLMGLKTLTAILVSLLTAVLVSGILPLIEMTFRITTNVSWMELSDLNHPLLKKMTIEAPGTYHHSLVVANLSEAAAEAIGANAAMCRVCAYFHDIGKLAKPSYFVENIMDGENPHDDLTPTMSALIVIAHVKDGVDLALKHKLNQEVIDVIKEHHGTSLMRYFYHRAVKQKEEIEAKVVEDKAREEDVPDVKEESFRYPGPRPRTKESAIISLADAVESASRSLQKPTPKKIEELIDELTKSRLNDGQLDSADLTLKELAMIKASFATTLRSMMHTRIAYPKEKEKADDAFETSSRSGNETQKLLSSPETQKHATKPKKSSSKDDSVIRK